MFWAFPFIYIRITEACKQAEMRNLHLIWYENIENLLNFPFWFMNKNWQHDTKSEDFRSLFVDEIQFLIFNFPFFMIIAADGMEIFLFSVRVL